jgi:hypothetical protein
MTAWDPQVQVLDETQIKDNLTAYLQANQAEALKWANGGASGLPAIRDFHKSPRLVTVFPGLTWLQTSHKSKWEDVLEIDFAIVLEVAIVHGNKDTLASRAPKYSMAIESMLVNVPETTFNQDSIIDITSTGMAVETTFDVQGKYKNQFIEVFQTRANWHIEASAFSR